MAVPTEDTAADTVKFLTDAVSVPDAAPITVTPVTSATGSGAGAGTGAGAGGSNARSGSSGERDGTEVQHPCGDAIPKALEAVISRGYVVDQFRLALSCPASTSIRDYALWFHLEGGIPFMRVLEIKEAFKAIVLTRMADVMPHTTFSTDGNMEITISFLHPSGDKEAAPFLGVDLAPPKKRRRRTMHSGRKVGLAANQGQISITKVIKAIGELHGAAPPSTKCPPDVLPQACTVVTGACRKPIFLKASYAKFVRNLSQTPWVLDGKRKGSTSVQEEISARVQTAFGASFCKFHSAGREDVDVRMLGSGRPFVLELLDATQSVASVGEEVFKGLEASINESSDIMQIKGLAPCDKTEFEALQSGADSKRKAYACVVWVSKVITPADLETLNRLKDVDVDQLTPVRVVHRRSLLNRKKIIHSMKAEYLNQHFFILRLVTSAGTYVKEFVHGDFGRTMPNVGSLLNCDADIIQLDVEGLLYPKADGSGEYEFRGEPIEG